MRTSAPCCPVHAGERLDGGPIQFYCPKRHAVWAADIPTERPAVTR